ncbi:MAG: LVIVD repeat-containing protein [Pyrinomonadaceae bacterium]
MDRIHQFTLRLIVTSLLICGSFAVAAVAQGEQAKPAPKLPPGMKGANTKDPRAKLAPGLYDAGEAALGIKHVSLQKKPEAFDLGIDPNSPKVTKALGAMGIPPNANVPPGIRMAVAGLALGNSDLAFQGNYVFMGNFYGMNIYDISNPAMAKLVTSMICPGGQGDVSVYKNLMFMSVEMPNGRIDCGEQGFPPAEGAGPGGPPAASKDRFRGVRIFDISDIRNPKQVGAVQTCRGSHTHTLVTDPKDKKNVYIYVSGTSFVRSSDELAGCSGGPPDKDPNTALFRIEVIKVPVAAPQDAKIVSTPRIFGDPATGAISVLKDAGSHDNKGRVEPTDQCHDITAYPEIGLAAGACSGNGILLDIKDPANPKRIDSVNDPNYAYWHSASFSNDAKKVVFTDEWGGGMAPRCRETDPDKWGANALFNLKNNKLEFVSYYKLPAAQTEQENCVAHNGSLIPIPGRDIKVQAWYQGGISIMDFTDAANPVEIAYFDRGPIDSKMLVMGGAWSAYWYNGFIYSSEIARGLDIFELVPTKHISQNEIDAAKSAKLSVLNVQTQERYKWPNKMAVAKAYLDQIERSQALPAGKIAELRDAVAKAEGSKLGKKERSELNKLAAYLESAAKAKSGSDSSRIAALASALTEGAL